MSARRPALTIPPSSVRAVSARCRTGLRGGMDVLWKDRILPHTTFRRLPGATTVEDDKTLDARVDAIMEDATKGARGTAITPGARDCGRLGL